MAHLVPCALPHHCKCLLGREGCRGGVEPQGGGLAYRISEFQCPAAVFGAQALLDGLQHLQLCVAESHGRDHGHTAELRRQVEIGLPALAHEGHGGLGVTGIGGWRISVEQVGHVGPWNQVVNELDERPAERIAQVEIYQFVVYVAVQYDDLRGPAPAFACDQQAKMKCIQQVKKVPHQRDMPSTNILVAPMHRLARCSNSPLALEYPMDKPFAVPGSYHHVVPESEEARLDAGGVQSLHQTGDLGRLAGAIHSGEADQQWGPGCWLCHAVPSYLGTAIGLVEPGGTEGVPRLRA